MKQFREYRKNSFRYKRNGWIYVHIEWEPYERGVQHGFYLANEIAEVMRTLEYIILKNTGKEFTYFMKWAGKTFAPYIDEEVLAELQGIVDGAAIRGVQTSIEALFVWNGLISLRKIIQVEWQTAGCSAISIPIEYIVLNWA